MCSLIGQRRTIEPNRNKSKSQSKVPSIMPHFRGSVGPKFVVPLCQVTDSFPYSSSVDFTHSARVIALIWFYDPQLKTHLKSVEDRYCSKKYIYFLSFPQMTLSNMFVLWRNVHQTLRYFTIISQLGHIFHVGEELVSQSAM